LVADSGLTRPYVAGLTGFDAPIKYIERTELPLSERDTHHGQATGGMNLN
jgi:hypothetical protein